MALKYHWIVCHGVICLRMYLREFGVRWRYIYYIYFWVLYILHLLLSVIFFFKLYFNLIFDCRQTLMPQIISNLYALQWLIKCGKTGNIDLKLNIMTVTLRRKLISRMSPIALSSSNGMPLSIIGVRMKGRYETFNWF